MLLLREMFHLLLLSSLWSSLSSSSLFFLFVFWFLHTVISSLGLFLIFFLIVKLVVVCRVWSSPAAEQACDTVLFHLLLLSSL